MVGAMLGGVLFGTMEGSQEGPRLADLKVQSSAFGAPLALTWGSVRLACNIIWSPGIREVSTTKTQGGGIFGGGMDITTYSYFFSGAFSLCDCRAGPITTVRRIWANNKLVYDARVNTESVETPPAEGVEGVIATLVNGLITGGWSVEIHTGTADQMPDPYIEANRFGYGSPGAAPAYRKTAYIVIKNFPLAEYGNAVPSFEFEIIRGTQVPPTYEYLDPPPNPPGVPNTPAIWGAGPSAAGWDVERNLVWSCYLEGCVVGIDPWTMTYKYLLRVDPLVTHLNQSDRYTTLHGNAGGGYWEFGTTSDMRYGCQLTERLGDIFNAGIGAITGRGSAVFCNNGFHTGYEYRKIGGVWTAIRRWVDPADAGGWLAADWQYSTGGGQYLYRAAQEAFPLVGEFYGSSFRIFGGRNGLSTTWFNSMGATFPLTGIPIETPQSADGSGLTFSQELSQWSVPSDNNFANPTIAHDRTRDRLWMAYNLPSGGGVKLFYLDLASVSGYSTYAWREVTHPTLAAWSTPTDCPVVAYNPDLDWVIVSGGNGANAYVVCFACNTESLAAPEPTYILDEPWGVNVPHAGHAGAVGYSRLNWIAGPSSRGNGMTKIYLGITYTADEVPLWQIVSDVCEMVGLDPADDYDVSELTDMVKGYAIARPTTARSAIEPLASAYFFDAVETGGG